jgi:hypothetical protein
MFGYIRSGAVLLTAAFTEQYHSIGWLQVLLSHIISKWETAFPTLQGAIQKSRFWQTPIEPTNNSILVIHKVALELLKLDYTWQISSRISQQDLAVSHQPCISLACYV